MPRGRKGPGGWGQALRSPWGGQVQPSRGPGAQGSAHPGPEVGGKDPLLHPPPRCVLQPGRPPYPGAEALPEMPAFLETKALLRGGGQGEAGLESCWPGEGVGPLWVGPLPWAPCQLRTPAGWQVGPSMPGPAFGAGRGRAGTTGGADGCSEWPAAESLVDPWPSPESPQHTPPTGSEPDAMWRGWQPPQRGL